LNPIRLISLLFLFFCNFISSNAINKTAIDSLNSQSWSKFELDKINSLNLGEKALYYSRKIKYSKGIAEANLNIANILFSNGNLSGSLQRLISAENEINKSGFKYPFISAKVYNQTARIFIELRNYEKAKFYVAKSFNLNKKLKDNKSLANNYVILSIIKSENFEIDSSEFFLNKALEIYKLMQDTSGLITVYNNLGYNCALKLDLKKEKDYYKKALNYTKNNDVNQIQVLYNLGESYLTENDYINSEKYAKIVFFKASLIKNNEMIQKSSYLLSKIYEGKKQFNFSLQYYKTFKIFSDSVNTFKTLSKINEIEIINNFERKLEKDSLKAGIEMDKINMKYRDELFARKLFLIGFILIFIVSIIIYNRYRLISKQNQIIQNQKREIEQKNTEIVDSINYAKTIQSAIIPTENNFTSILKNSFIFFKPKDIVSGDFYWIQQIENNIYFAACDCTGHGVPGAMMSMICNNALNKCIKELGVRTTGNILDKASELILEEFSNANNSNIKDGMDISLCRIAGEKLEWSGANLPLCIIRNDELIELKPTKQAIGFNYDKVAFNSIEFSLMSGDNIYLFTDGYADQFGGVHNKKFKKTSLKKLMIENSNLSMHLQKEIFESVFMDWKNKNEQIDDVTIIGYKHLIS